MDRRERFSWMVAPKGFVSLLGAEYELLRKSGTNILVKFYLSSLIIVLILLISFLSIRYAIDLLFHVRAMEILLSVFFSFLFVFIYIFLINTFTKQEIESTNRYLTFSNLIRIGFIIFMAFIISKPIEIFVFGNILEQDVDQYKSEVLREHQKKIDALYADDLNRLQQRAAYFQVFTSPSDQLFKPELKALYEKINKINEKKKQFMEVAKQRVQNSPFFVYKMKLLAYRYWLSYLVCLGIIILFLLPGNIIYSISKNDLYYKLKKEYEQNLILRNYQAFTEQYRLLSFQKFGVEKEFYTVYEDPPFNTKRKPDHNYQAQNEFFKKYS